MPKRVGLRDRLLRCSFFTSEQVCSVPYMARLLFEGLWCMADREGRLEDRPRLIKKELFPFDDETELTIDAALDVLWCTKDLYGVGMIERYTIGNTSYIWIPKFKENQKCHPNEAKSVIPPYEKVHQRKHLGSPKVHDVALKLETRNLPTDSDSDSEEKDTRAVITIPPDESAKTESQTTPNGPIEEFQKPFPDRNGKLDPKDDPVIAKAMSTGYRPERHDPTADPFAGEGVEA